MDDRYVEEITSARWSIEANWINIRIRRTHIRHQRTRLSRRPRAMMSLGNSLLAVRTHRTFAAHGRWIQDDRRDLFRIINRLVVCRRSFELPSRAAGAWWCSSCSPLASCRAGGAPRHRTWRVAHRSARPVWLGGSRALHFFVSIFLLRQKLGWKI